MLELNSTCGLTPEDFIQRQITLFGTTQFNYICIVVSSGSLQALATSLASFAFPSFLPLYICNNCCKIHPSPFDRLVSNNGSSWMFQAQRETPKSLNQLTVSAFGPTRKTKNLVNASFVIRCLQVFPF